MLVRFFQLKIDSLVRVFLHVFRGLLGGDLIGGRGVDLQRRGQHRFAAAIVAVLDLAKNTLVEVARRFHGRPGVGLRLQLGR